MADKSAIEWTDASWTAIRARNLKTGKVGWHCEHATTGCEFCYSEGFNKRLGTGLPFKPGHRKDIEIFLDEHLLTQPLRWKKPRMIFVCSMTDLFADFVPDEWIDKVFAVMALCPQHTFQVLTKRAARMRDYLSREDQPNRLAWEVTAQVMNAWQPNWKSEPVHGANRGRAIAAFSKWPLPNCWLGVSTERQQEADERIPLLLQTPAAVRFISAEPLLGPVDLEDIVAKHEKYEAHRSALECDVAIEDDEEFNGAVIDWVITGGESGPKARPSHPQWFRDIRDACARNGVAYFHKQNGEWAPGECAEGPPTRSERGATWFGGKWLFETITPRVSQETHTDDAPDVYRLGKKQAGRHLDGALHNASPGKTFETVYDGHLPEGSSS